MDKVTGIPIAQKINRVFLIGAALLILAYGLLFKASILVTENKTSMHRLVLVGPHYFKSYQQGLQGKIAIDPLLTSFDDYQLLPEKIISRISPDWSGIDSLHFSKDDTEVAIFSQEIAGKKYYLVENVNAIEWSDNAFRMLELIILSCGLALFLLTSTFVKNKAIKLSVPFTQLAKRLSTDPGEAFEKIDIDGTTTLELKQTLEAVNSYREKIALAMTREQSFTRYISHELRTPMTVIKGSLSVLRKQEHQHISKQCQRIARAVDDMQALTQTFLLLARDELNARQALKIDKELIEKQLQDLSSYITSNQCCINLQILENVELVVEEVLFTALVKNLLLNAINNTPNGNISIFIEQKQLMIVDNGSGLEHQHRGYEGFGIGLILVRDICQKYHWLFSLENNLEISQENNNDKGCRAIVTFSS